MRQKSETNTIKLSIQEG